MSPDCSSLIILKGESNLDSWARALRVKLDCADLYDYIIKDIPEPDKTTQKEEHKEWRTNRALTVKIIQSTLKDDNVITTLRINGWDEENRDPKYLYDLIRTTIGKVTNEARSDVLEEYQSLKRSAFDSMSSFLFRYNLLRKRVRDCGLIIDNTVECLNLFNMVKRSYPTDAKLWAADIAKGQLTTLTLLAQLSVLGNTEAR